jgi:hypothetical protein
MPEWNAVVAMGCSRTWRPWKARSPWPQTPGWTQKWISSVSPRVASS